MEKKHATHLLTQLIIKHGQVRHKEALDSICAPCPGGWRIRKLTKLEAEEISYAFISSSREARCELRDTVKLLTGKVLKTPELRKALRAVVLKFLLSSEVGI